MTDTHGAPAHSEDASEPTAGTPPVLSFEEGRLIGCLVEKERTTPAEYPLTANALMRACNQSTSRHPVVSFDERTVESALTAMKGRGLVRFVHSQSNRATKYRHVIDEAWSLTPDQVAVLCILLLRGPQTPGEIRTRSDRLHPFDSPGQVESTLQALAGSEPAMVLELERGAGQKERRWAQLLTGAPTAEDLAVATSGGVRTVSRHAPDDALVQQLAAQDARIQVLEGRVEHLRTLLEELAGPIDD